MNIRLTTFIVIVLSFLIGLTSGYFIGTNTQKQFDKQKELFFKYELNRIG